ncbi:MAG: hypothetical protein HXK06_03690 [Actinomyces graevenitzii]|jgi:lipoprotein|nr:hypothetical protein [Actinomyces graevenitzii]
MKKLSMVMSVMACAALVLSGCGNSVSDDRAQAYASLSSMTSLSEDQADKYKEKLTAAPDSAAIKSVLADAKATNDKNRADDAKYAANKAALDKAAKKAADAITGVKLVGTTGACVDVTLVFNADKTWQMSSGTPRGACMPDYKYWGIEANEDGTVYLVFGDSKDAVDNSSTPEYSSVTESYQLTLNDDGTVNIGTSNNDKFTITK